MCRGILLYRTLGRYADAFERERQKNAEAELAWLKNQLNPHFL